MNCINCGARLTEHDVEYCSHCGFNVMIQKKVDYLSKHYYNKGLEKASIRDLSGAISCLKRSLTFNKANIQARNLLGLVYFETGEVVAALSEWVISKNLQPTRNLASSYIEKLQANKGKLDAINDTIRKYNHALELCREGHEDMAAIRLKKILVQNPKLIKGYHLLALIQIKQEDYGKARRTLKRAARIDKTNTTTLRFLREVDEKTGEITKLEVKGKRAKAKIREEEEEYKSLVLSEGSDRLAAASYSGGKRRMKVFTTLLAGFAAGLAAFGFLAVPAVKQKIYQEANRQIIQYSDSLAAQGAQLTQMKGKTEEADVTAQAVQNKLDEEQEISDSYENLLAAYNSMQGQDLDSAALSIQNVRKYRLSESAQQIYESVCSATGVRGIDEEPAKDSADGQSPDSQETEGEAGTENTEGVSKPEGDEPQADSHSGAYGQGEDAVQGAYEDNSGAYGPDGSYGDGGYGTGDYGDGGYGTGDYGDGGY